MPVFFPRATVSAWQSQVSHFEGLEPGLGKQRPKREGGVLSVEEDEERGCGDPHGESSDPRVLLQLPEWAASPLTPACPVPTRVIKETESEKGPLKAGSVPERNLF